MGLHKKRTSYQRGDCTLSSKRCNQTGLESPLQSLSLSDGLFRWPPITQTRFCGVTGKLPESVQAVATASHGVVDSISLLWGVPLPLLSGQSSLPNEPNLYCVFEAPFKWLLLLLLKCVGIAGAAEG